MDKRKKKPVDVEARIRQQYRVLRGNHRRRGGDYYGGSHGMAAVFMVLAMRWKRPIVEIKRIVNYKGAANRPVVYQTAEEHRLTRAHIQAEQIRREMEWNK